MQRASVAEGQHIVLIAHTIASCMHMCAYIMNSYLATGSINLLVTHSESSSL